MSLAPGGRFGAYEIGVLLGAGGMGRVYAARDTRLGREVALKLLPPGEGADEAARRRLEREARLAAQLNHPHICTVHEVGEAEGLVYVAMERVEGRPLDALAGPQGLPAEEVARLGAQIADALAYAHAHGIVHRDLKGANVLVGGDGRVKVLDFGLARQVAAAAAPARTQTLTETATLSGTLQYMPPEALRGGAADARGDLWSLGVVLYELASGARPFRGATPVELGAAILERPPEPLPARVPRRLAVVIERCLAKDPARRWAHAGDVQAALEAVAAGRPPAARAAWRWWWAGVAAAVLVVVGLDLGSHAPPGRTLLDLLLPPPRPRGPIASLAVLPLQDLSNDPGQRYFADGMTDELTTRLAQVGRWRVTSRTSAMTFQGTRLPLPEIGRRLGVDALVEGSVLRAGGRVRITAQLVRAATDEHLWAQTYERDLRDVIALQDEVAGAIAEQVRRRLASAGGGRIPQGPPQGSSPGAVAAVAARPVSPRGYELYLRALEAYHRWTRAGDYNAVALLGQALLADSTYAPAWAALGLVYLDDPGLFGGVDQDVGRARNAVARALALDPNLGLAHAVAAQIAFERDRDWVTAEREFRRGIELAPNLFEAHHEYAHLLMDMGRTGESLERSRIALALDPLNPAAVLHMGWADLYTGDWPAALAQFHAAIARDPQSSEAWRFLWEAYVVTGRCDSAAVAAREALRFADPADTVSTAVHMRSALAMNAAIAARCGRAADATRMLAVMRSGNARGTVPAYDVASVCALLGRNDEAFGWLDRALRAREQYALALRVDPFLAGLRADPRFAALLRRLGLPA